MLHLPSPAVWVTDRKIALIEAIQSSHPGTSIVLCVWHINMDVRGYASKLLKQTELVNDLIKDWENVVYSNTAKNYMDNRKKFEDRYTLSENHNHANPFSELESGISESHIDAAIAYQNLRKSYEQIIKYVQQTWLIPWRHYFVKCYTNKLLHLDTTTIQRTESAHRALKTQSGFSTGDLRTVVNSIELLLENQLDDLRQKLSSTKMSSCISTEYQFFVKL
ncbi:hypothetical protein K3495_g10317 [Podosphaera aphanis]|nr:hypothetical protein K3495_g10317 [Podosphaera aphanis]